MWDIHRMCIYIYTYIYIYIYIYLCKRRLGGATSTGVTTSTTTTTTTTTTHIFPYLAFYWFSLRFLKNLLHIWNVFANSIRFFFSYYWFYHFQKYNHIRKTQLLLDWRIHNQFSLRFDRIDNDIWCQKERFASHLHGPQKSTTKYVFLDFSENS